jgi:hypothetical protein
LFQIVLINGRKRLEDCRLVGVEPMIEWLDDGMEADRYIYSSNIIAATSTQGSAQWRLQ